MFHYHENYLLCNDKDNNPMTHDNNILKKIMNIMIAFTIHYH